MNDNIQWQKWHHNRKLNWQSYNKGDKVYDYFPRRKVGTSQKFFSYRQGPFEEIEKYSNVTYKVSCDARRTHQVIHTNRIRPVVEHILRGKQDEEVTSNKQEAAYSNQIDDDKLVNDVTSRKRSKTTSYIVDFLSF